MYLNIWSILLDMAIIRKAVTKSGGTGHIILPKQLVGKEVWVVSDDDMDELKDLIQTTLLYRKAYKHDQDSFMKDYEDFKRDIKYKVKRLEDILIQV